MEKLEATLWRDNSPRCLALEKSLAQLGYRLRTIISSTPEPTISTQTLYAHGCQNILSVLGLI